MGSSTTLLTSETWLRLIDKENFHTFTNTFSPTFMPTSAAAIDRTTADEARIELESHNQGLIATSQAESSPSFLHLNTSEALTKVSKACEAFGKVSRSCSSRIK